MLYPVNWMVLQAAGLGTLMETNCHTQYVQLGYQINLINTICLLVL